MQNGRTKAGLIRGMNHEENTIKKQEQPLKPASAPTVGIEPTTTRLKAVRSTG